MVSLVFNCQTRTHLGSICWGNNTWGEQNSRQHCWKKQKFRGSWKVDEHENWLLTDTWKHYEICWDLRWLQVAPQRGRALPDKDRRERECVSTSISTGITAEDKTETFLFYAQETGDHLCQEFVKRWLIKAEASESAEALIFDTLLKQKLQTFSTQTAQHQIKVAGQNVIIKCWPLTFLQIVFYCKVMRIWPIWSLFVWAGLNAMGTGDTSWHSLQIRKTPHS